MKRVRWWSGLLLVSWLASCGCDGSGSAPPASSSTAQAEVKGKVTLKGKPLSKVTVNFNPANVNRRTASTASAQVTDDGTYEIKTLVGENAVTLTGPGVAKDPKAQYYSKTIDVKDGSNTLDIEIE